VHIKFIRYLRFSLTSLLGFFYCSGATLYGRQINLRLNNCTNQTVTGFQDTGWFMTPQPGVKG